MQTHPECYGGIFPDLSVKRFNTLLKGKAFDVSVKTSGFGVTDRIQSVNVSEWDKCTACSAFPGCYQLSIAKLILNAVVQDYGMTPAV